MYLCPPFTNAHNFTTFQNILLREVLACSCTIFCAIFGVFFFCLFKYVHEEPVNILNCVHRDTRAQLCRSTSSPCCSRMQALVRMGLLTANLDSPMRSAWSNTKCPKWNTYKPCPCCDFTQPQLGDPTLDVLKNKRTADGVVSDLAYAAEGLTDAERAKRSRDRRVFVFEIGESSARAHVRPCSSILH